jgi:hypothetical protein
VSDHPASVTSYTPPAPLSAPRVTAAAWALVGLGMAAFAGTWLMGEHDRAMSGVLHGVMIPLDIAIGALFFISVHAVAGAHWTVPLRRVMEGLSGGLLVALIGFIILVVGMPALYAWADGDAVVHAGLFHASDGAKAGWMTVGRIATTGLISLAVWGVLRWRLVGLSLRQDKGQDVTGPHQRWAVAFLLLFALPFTLFVWDLLLSLDVPVVSTMWGIYCFVGGLQTFLAVLILVLAWLRGGPLKDVVKPHALHDLGTWMVAWACIWAYIAYAQYVIIYFANMNDEAMFFLKRSQHGYDWVYTIESLLRFVVPFALLMSQRLRNHPRALAVAAVAVLIGGWLDLGWIIAPAVSPNRFIAEVPELLIAGGFIGGMLLVALGFWRRHGLVPVGDPRLISSLNAEHLH